MSLNLFLTTEEKALLDQVSRQSKRSQDDLIHRSIREYCKRQLKQTTPSSYQLGRDLFGAGHLADAPTDPVKRQIWERLHAKHRRLD